MTCCQENPFLEPYRLSPIILTCAAGLDGGMISLGPKRVCRHGPEHSILH